MAQSQVALEQLQWLMVCIDKLLGFNMYMISLKTYPAGCKAVKSSKMFANITECLQTSMVSSNPYLTVFIGFINTT